MSTYTHTPPKGHKIPHYVYPGIVSQQKGYNTTVSDIMIQQMVCNEFGITMEELLGPRGKLHVSQPRQISMFLIRCIRPAVGSGRNKSDYDGAYSLKQIGLMHGGRDHSTVLHSIGVVCNDYTYNDTLRARIQRIAQQIDVNFANDLPIIIKKLQNQ